MTTDNPIAKHLKEYHCGELRVVPSRELEAAFQIRGPDLRRTINCLRGDGIPICSSDSGYYYADTEEELRVLMGYQTEPADTVSTLTYLISTVDSARFPWATACT